MRRALLYSLAFVVVVCLICLVIPSYASAHRNGTYITTTQAEDNIVNSKWGERHNVDDAYCEGKERPRIAGGEMFYKHFKCELDVTVYLWNSDRTCHTVISYHSLDGIRFAVTDYDELGCDYNQ